MEVDVGIEKDVVDVEVVFLATAGSGGDVDARPSSLTSLLSPLPPGTSPGVLLFAAFCASLGCAVDVEVSKGISGSTVVDVDVVYVCVEAKKGTPTLLWWWLLLLPPSPFPTKMQCSDPSLLLARGPVVDQSSQYPSDGVNTKLAHAPFALHSVVHASMV